MMTPPFPSAWLRGCVGHGPRPDGHQHLLVLIPGYILALVLCRFVPPVFIGIAFDSGGVTTGPMTRAFIMALGVGVASIRSRRECRPGQLRPGGSLFCRPHPGSDGAGPDLPGRGVYHPGGNPLRDRQPGSVHLFQVELPAYLSEVAVCLAPSHCSSPFFRRFP